MSCLSRSLFRRNSIEPALRKSSSAELGGRMRYGRSSLANELTGSAQNTRFQDSSWAGRALNLPPLRGHVRHKPAYHTEGERPRSPMSPYVHHPTDVLSLVYKPRHRRCACATPALPQLSSSLAYGPSRTLRTPALPGGPSPPPSFFDSVLPDTVHGLDGTARDGTGQGGEGRQLIP